MNRKSKKKLQELILKCSEYDDEYLQTFLEMSLKYNHHCFRNEFTPLMYAASNGYTEIVQVLLETGAPAYMKNNYGYTALFYAIIKNHMDIVNLLIENSGLENASSLDLLDAAIEAKSFEMMQIIISKVPNINEEFFSYGLSKIVQKDFDIKEKIKIMKLLLDKGADPNCTNFPNYIGNPALICALNINSNNYEIIKLLLDNKANPNYTSENSTPPLIRATSKNKEDIISLLLEYGADINIKDKDGNTALMAAVTLQNVKLVEFLLNRGANINILNNKSESVLYTAIRMNDLEMVKFLLSYTKTNALILKNNPYGANPNINNIIGQSPLMLAIMVNNLEIIKLLIDYGVEVDNQSIGTAFSNDKIEIAHYLLGHVNREETFTKKLIK